MRTLFLLAPAALLLAGCDLLPDDDLAPGTARIEIESVTYEAYAAFETVTLGETPYERIRLTLDGGDGTLDLVCQHFTRGTHRRHYPDASDFFAALHQYGDHPSLHSSEDGELHVDRVTDGEVRGRFTVTLQNAAASCIRCPDETLVHASGTFFAIAP